MRRSSIVRRLMVLATLLFVSAAGAVATGVAAQAKPMQPRVTYGEYLAVMYSRSLGQPFGYRSDDLSTAEGVAYNECLRYAQTHQDVYQNDCSRGLWVHEGYISVYESGPYSRGPDQFHGQPYAWGFGWARTLEQARANASYYCRANGGQYCGEQLWYNDVFSVNGPMGPTTGGNWYV